MLRRAKKISFEDEGDIAVDEAPRAASGLRRATRDSAAEVSNFEAWRTDPDQADEPPRPAPAPQPAIRLERLSQEDLRAEVQRALGPQLARQAGGDRLSGFSLGRIRPSRIMLVMVAVMAGGLAAYLALNREPPAPAEVPAAVEGAPPPVEARPAVHVLVAGRAIGLGERVTEDALSWQAWPADALRSEYITDTATPNAIADMVGEVARVELFPGEPVNAAKLVATDGGYMSAVLQDGLRGVAVPVDAQSASGGFIFPNDHVDVIATRTTPDGQQARTILHNVRVLAIDTRLGETGKTGAPANPDDPRADIFAGEAIATLALDPVQSEMIAAAGSEGKLSLVLVALGDASRTNSAELSRNDAIRMTSPFWK